MMEQMGKSVGYGKSVAVMATTCAALLVSGCGSRDEGKPAPAPTEASRPAQVKSPVDFSDDPKEKHRQQTEIVDHMMEDMRIPTDTVMGEAARRGVDIAPAKLETRRIAEKAQPTR